MIRTVKASTLLLLLHLLAGTGAAAPALNPTTAYGLLQAAHDAHAPVVLVHLWATWCPPCRDEFPVVVDLERKYRDRGLKVLLVSADVADNLAAVQDFLARHGVDYPTFIKAQDDVAFVNGLGGKWQGELPASLFLDGSGRLAKWWPGPGDQERFEQTVDGLLKSAGPQEKSP